MSDVIRRYEVRRIGGRVFCVTEPDADPLGQRGYVHSMVNVVEVTGQWAGGRFALPRAQVEAGELLAESRDGG